MERLQSRHGYDKVDGALRFLYFGLAGQPETEHLAADVKALRTDLFQKEEAYRDAKEIRIVSTARIRYLDAKADDAVQDVALQVLTAVGRDREHPRYQKIFPVAPSQGTTPVAGPAQARFVRQVADALEQDGALAGHAAGLREAQDAVDAEIARREDLYIPEARTLAERNAALDAARRAYNTMHARLTLLFPDDPRFVESFFADLEGRRGSTGDDAEDAG